jgi:membrane protein implicated in regulation of membrane protease activity
MPRCARCRSTARARFDATVARRAWWSGGSTRSRRATSPPSPLLIVVAILLLVFVLSPALGIAVVALAVAFEAVELVFWRRVLRRHRVATGAEAMEGEVAVVVEPCEPAGTVRLRGEIWRATCEAGARSGERVRVAAVDGLTLEVVPLEDGTEKGPG